MIRCKRDILCNLSQKLPDHDDQKHQDKIWHQHKRSVLIKNYFASNKKSDIRKILSKHLLKPQRQSSDSTPQHHLCYSFYVPIFILDPGGWQLQSPKRLLPGRCIWWWGGNIIGNTIPFLYSPQSIQSSLQFYQPIKEGKTYCCRKKLSN